MQLCSCTDLLTSQSREAFFCPSVSATLLVFIFFTAFIIIWSYLIMCVSPFLQGRFLSCMLLYFFRLGALFLFIEWVNDHHHEHKTTLENQSWSLSKMSVRWLILQIYPTASFQWPTTEVYGGRGWGRQGPGSLFHFSLLPTAGTGGQILSGQNSSAFHDCLWLSLSVEKHFGTFTMNVIFKTPGKKRKWWELLLEFRWVEHQSSPSWSVERKIMEGKQESTVVVTKEVLSAFS